MSPTGPTRRVDGVHGFDSIAVYQGKATSAVPTIQHTGKGVSSTTARRERIEPNTSTSSIGTTVATGTIASLLPLVDHVTARLDVWTTDLDLSEVGEVPVERVKCTAESLVRPKISSRPRVSHLPSFPLQARRNPTRSFRLQLTSTGVSILPANLLGLYLSLVLKHPSPALLEKA